MTEVNMPKKKKNEPHDRTCRTAEGGCGRQVVIIQEDYKAGFGTSWQRTAQRRVAVHEADLAGRATVRCDPRTFYKLRGELENRCAAARAE